MRVLLAVLLMALLVGCKPSTEPMLVPREQVAAKTAPAPTLTTCDHPVVTTGEPVVCVIDGDTFKLDDGTSVRLIGMDTPERGQEGYEEATSALVDLLNKSYVHFEKDVSDTDTFGRKLRYVYATDYFVNEVLVQEGWARAKDYPPDISHAALFHQTEAKAHEAHVGLWQ